MAETCQVEMSSSERQMTTGHRRARVLAVDDHPPFLAVLRDVVRATDQLESVGEAESGELAVEAAHELLPDVVLMDVRMPGLDGIAAAKLIKADRASTLVVLISTTHPSELGLEPDDTLADAVLWKSELEPRVLDQIWLRYQDRAQP
jgi:DNA-binding NarL/FixJ family response regulator